MKFSFKIQQYQTDAVDAVARVFQGQPYSAGVSYLRDMGSLSAKPKQLSLMPMADDAAQLELQDLINDSGFKNEALQLTDADLVQNIRALQAESNIHQSDKLVAPLGRCSLDIEMETGTGKTYVYIKTMFELNKRYGWSKFIVVVPSIAIREGVKKSFEITADHFMECYGKKARFFIYNSSNLNQLDSFSSNSGINVMIINTQAFAASMNEDKNVEGRKGDAAARIIYTKRDEFGSRRPIDVIAANRPILILDEPLDGLDPVMRKQIWTILMSEVAERRTTVLVSSHNLRELEDVCDHVGIMNHGKVIIERSLFDLHGNISKIQVACQTGMPKLPKEFEVLHMSNSGRVYTMIVKGNPREVAAAIQTEGDHLAIVDILPLTLEEIFIYEMGGLGYEVKDILF